jgi:hypothetical protein
MEKSVFILSTVIGFYSNFLFCDISKSTFFEIVFKVEVGSSLKLLQLLISLTCF